MDPRLRNYLLWQKQRGLRLPMLRPRGITAQPSLAPMEVPQSVQDPELVSRAEVHEPLSRAQKSSTVETKILVVFITDHPTSEGKALTPEETSLFEKMTAAMNLSQQEVFVTHALTTQLSPHGDLHLSDNALRTAREGLDAVLADYAPPLVICFGRIALKCLLGPQAQFRALAGQELHSRGSHQHRILATYHPRDLLRHPENKRETWHHLQRAMDWLGLNQRTRPLNP